MLSHFINEKKEEPSLKLVLTGSLLSTKTEKEEYDVIIVGAGIAGLTAALYSARYGMKTLVIYKDHGTTATASLIEDYPGFKSISGEELVKRILDQIAPYNVPMILDTVSDIRGSFKEKFRVISYSGEYISRTVILAVGARRRKLGVPGEEKLTGRGVSYCAVCDAPLFKNKVVAVVGGGDSAVKEAIHLAYYADKVYIIHRREVLKAMPLLIKKLEKYSNIELILGRQIKSIKGDDRVEGIELDDGSFLCVEGVFIDIGLEPPVEFFKNIGLRTDEKGYVVVDENQMTSIKGIFAAGDCTNACRGFHQLVTAAAQGALAADSAYRLVLNHYGKTLLRLGTYR